ncbi:hypothetical protein CAP48_02005 [Advenella sp. S44]|uniref:PhzF family phenazine biosynthesis protein n=1 Tax=Advenella sp. S44 TaxID=1982755 RepID=UPI000C2A5810|nr:hypothetical protein CAP48_02005 [Advenella sp. S44]
MSNVFCNCSYVGGLTYAFCIDGQLGNPSFVLLSKNSRIVERKMVLGIANRYSCEVTLAEWQPATSTFKLRYFTSSGEIDFCGHGTLAAAAWLSKFHSIGAPMEFSVLGGSVIVDRFGQNEWGYRQATFSLIELFCKYPIFNTPHT